MEPNLSKSAAVQLNGAKQTLNRSTDDDCVYMRKADPVLNRSNESQIWSRSVWIYTCI